MSVLTYQDIDIAQLSLDAQNRKLRAVRIEHQVIAGEIERTIDGSSTLTFTVHDPHRVLLRSQLLDWTARAASASAQEQTAIDLTFDGIEWRLVKVEKSSDDLTLTFEDKVVALLRLDDTPKKATRGKVTRAEFALSLVREAGAEIPFYSPDLHLKQPVAPIENKRQKKKKNDNPEPGLNLSAPLKMRDVSGHVYEATNEQVRNAQKMLDVAASMQAPAKAAKALIEAGMVESSLRNLTFGHSSSTGILQLLKGTAQGLGINPRDVEAVSAAFLNVGFWTDPELGKDGAIGHVRRWPGVSAGRIAQACQGSAHPERYDAMQKEAQAFLDAYNGSGIQTSPDESRKKNLPFQFRRGGVDGEIENSWEALQRLASDVQWRCFVERGTVFFASDDTLLRAKPELRLSDDTLGIDTVDFDCDAGKSEESATVIGRASRWQAGPGMVVELFDEGPANGRWLVSNLRRGIFDPKLEISLIRGTKPEKEPSPEQETVDPDQGDVGIGAYGAASYAEGSIFAAAWKEAHRIDKKRYPYVWGGGHARAGIPDHGVPRGGSGPSPEVGFDCSGAVCAVLSAAGMGIERGGGVLSSDGLMNWGRAGKGEHMTVWTRTGSTTGHAFIVFHNAIAPGSQHHWGTGNWGKGWDGAGFNPNMHSLLERFTPRHWPGDKRAPGPVARDPNRQSDDGRGGV